MNPSHFSGGEMQKISLPLKNPWPDAKRFCDVIRGNVIPEKPPLVELIINPEIVSKIIETRLGGKWVFPDDIESSKVYLRNLIECWYRLGYDYIRIGGSISRAAGGGLDYPVKRRVTDDTAELTFGKRQWAEEGTGVIASWKDFESYPWPSAEKVNLFPYEFVSENLPEGMGMFVCPASGVLEVVADLLGYQGLSYALYDQPDLVEAVFNRVGENLLGFYKRVVGLKNLCGFFQGDDWGFKTSTLVSPEILRKYVIPWHKKIAEVAHKNGLLYLFHCCGNIESVMEDVINEIKADAKHSFEDSIMPVAEFKKKYGRRIAVLGGIDVDVLARSSEEELRRYVREVLKACMPGGRYCLGSGNSVANYVPVENYLIMLEEGLNWGG